MKLKYLTLLCLAVGGASAQAAQAQTADSLNPAVNTSPTQALPATSQASPALPVVQAGQAPPGGVTDPAAKPAPAAHEPSAGAGAPSTATTAGSRVTAAAASAAAPGTSDRIELGTTEISGNRELPKLMYIVPWQRAAVGKITGRPPNSLVDEVLTPVDRTVFERQNNYFAALQAASASAPSQPAAPGAPPGGAGPRDER